MKPDEWEKLKAEYGASCSDYLHLAHVDGPHITCEEFSFAAYGRGHVIAFYRKNEHGDFIRLERKPQKKRIEFKTGAEAVAWAASHPGQSVVAKRGLALVHLDVSRSGHVAAILNDFYVSTPVPLSVLEDCTNWHVEVEAARPDTLAELQADAQKNNMGY